MSTEAKLSKLSLAALGLAALALAAFPHAVSAGNGWNPSSQGGTSCKGGGACLLLEIECKGKYTDATDAHGTVYGHCSKTAQKGGVSKVKVKAN